MPFGQSRQLALKGIGKFKDVFAISQPAVQQPRQSMIGTRCLVPKRGHGGAHIIFEIPDA